jgi:hypothetical protein
MHTKNNNKRTRLSVESLEERTVPTYFGAVGGESIAIGDVMPFSLIKQNEIITGNGPGEPGIVQIRSPSNQLMQSFYPFGTAYTKGIYVASADVVGDGQDDIIVGTGAGTVGVVKVYEYVDGGLQLISTFLPFGPTYTGGVNVAAGNVTGPLLTTANVGAAAEVVVGMASGGSTVEVYGYNDTGDSPTYYQLRSFVAYPGYTGGVTLAVADIDTQLDTANTSTVNHDYASIITGEATGLPLVAIFNAQQPTVTLRAEYYAYSPSIASDDHGINVAAGDTDGTRGAQIYVNLRGTGMIRVFVGETSAIVTTITSTYPPAYGTMVNMAVGAIDSYAPSQDDEVVGTYYVRDLVVVAANISIDQVPVAFDGKANKPAGLNGSHAT